MKRFFAVAFIVSILLGIYIFPNNVQTMPVQAASINTQQMPYEHKYDIRHITSTYLGGSNGYKYHSNGMIWIESHEDYISIMNMNDSNSTDLVFECDRDSHKPFLAYLIENADEIVKFSSIYYNDFLGPIKKPSCLFLMIKII